MKLRSVSAGGCNGCEMEINAMSNVNFGKFNLPKGSADSWVYVYDAESLKELARHQVQEVDHGAGGIDIQKMRRHA